MTLESISSDVWGIWFLIGAALVFFMQCGFAMVETGFTRAKNAGNIIMKNLMDFCIGTVVFMLLGGSLMLAEDYVMGLIGVPNLNIFSDYGNFDAKSFVFNLVFCATAATIVSGAMAERTKFITYCIYSGVISAVIYPIEAGWVWNSQGWLAELGYIDFAGSSVIHMVGGITAFIGAALLGPRIGKYTRDKNGKVTKVNAIPGHSLTIGALGCFVLWFGWYGFNGAACTFLEGGVGSLASVFLTTTISPAVACCVTMIFTWIKDGKPIFQIGDKPSINWEESTYIPSTAGNSSNITLTGASDPEALIKEYDWSSTADTLNKAGTFTLYFGDVVEPRLVEVEVEVQERAPVVPYFTSKWPFAYETGNGVMTESDYENEITNVSLPLPSGPDTIGVSVSYYCEPPFDVSGIAISYSEEGIATASLAEGEDGLVLTVTPLEVGQTTITLTSSYVLGPDDYGQTEAKLAVTVTPDAPVVLEGWDKLKADWEETTIYSYGMGLACPSEPTFPYEAAELYEEAGMINVSNYLYIKATQDCVDLFIEQLLTEGAIIDGTRVEYASSTNSDGNTVLTADVYSVVIEWDSSNEMILATFTY